MIMPEHYPAEFAEICEHIASGGKPVVIRCDTWGQARNLATSFYKWRAAIRLTEAGKALSTEEVMITCPSKRVAGEVEVAFIARGSLAIVSKLKAALAAAAAPPEGEENG